MKLILITILILTVACDKNKSLTKEITQVAKENNFPYSTVLKKAKDGNELSIEIMIQFYEKTDTSSAFSHSVYMYEVLESVGEETFLKVLLKQNSKLIKWTLGWLQDRNSNLYQDYPKLKELKS